MFGQSEVFFFFQAEDGIRYLVRSRGLGDVYKRQLPVDAHPRHGHRQAAGERGKATDVKGLRALLDACLLYTSDAAAERSRVDLGGCRVIEKKKKYTIEDR